MRVREAVEVFLLAVEARGGRPRTVGSYRQRLGLLAGFLETRGIVGVEDVTPEVLDGFVVSMRRQRERWKDHPLHGPVKGGLSEATIAGRIQAMKAFFAFLVERGYIERSPARHLRKPRLEQSADERAMRLDDFVAMVEAAEGRVRDRALLLFLFETGCRVGEVASLRVGRLDLSGLMARVEGKTGVHVVDFTEWTGGALRAWLEVRPACDDDYVFVDRSGRPMSTRAMARALARLGERAGVKGRCNPHSIRHLVGQLWTDEANLELARQKLNHKDVYITARFYAGQDRARVRATTQRLSREVRRMGNGL